MTFLENFALQNESKIENWIAKKLEGQTPFFYGSCDVRYSGLKITQVDTNCFSAGFNNLTKESFEKAIAVYREFFAYRKIKSVLIYPEFHTRNYGYLKNVRTLKAIFEEAGVVVKIATNLETKFNIDLSVSDIKSISEELGLAENSLDFDPICKHKWFFQKKSSIGVKGDSKTECFVADAIVLNNDLTSGMPEVLKNVKAEILPSAKMGWWRRKKTEHFKHYSEIVKEFATDFTLDPWLFDAYFEEVENMDFGKPESLQILSEKLEILYAKITAKYKEYGIKEQPSIFIKSNKGTYGMGIHVISNPEEVKHFNKNIRKKMSVIKDGLENTSIILQEGVPTIFTSNERAVEPVVYSVLSKPIGMFFRINDGEIANLNGKGMEFSTDFELTKSQKILSNLIASLANLAVILELKSL